MSVNLFTLNVIKRTPFAINLCDTLGGYVLNYLISEDNTVDNITEEKTIILLKLCNLFAEMNNMQDLCDIYDVFGLEQDVMIIYYAIVQQLIEDLHQVE